MNTLALTFVRTTMKRSSPRGLTAEIIWTLERCPVSRATGIFPLGFRVLSSVKVKGTQVSLSKKIFALSRLAWARIFGYSAFNQCSTSA